MKASGYIMKPVTKADVERELSDLRFPIIPKSNALLRVQCFGNFDVFTPDGSHVRFVRSYNALAVNVDVLDCDYYRFQELDAGAVNAYESEYMSQYSWADFLYNGY